MPKAAISRAIPFAQHFLSEDMSDLRSARLLGSRCLECHVILFGVRGRCENCSSKNLCAEQLSATGTVYTFTIQRYPPPPPYQATNPWTPRPIAWIDLDEAGPRILGAVDCAAENMSIGMRVGVVLAPAWRDASDEIIGYSFVPLPATASRGHG